MTQARDRVGPIAICQHLLINSFALERHRRVLSDQTRGAINSIFSFDGSKENWRANQDRYGPVAFPCIAHIAFQLPHIARPMIFLKDILCSGEYSRNFFSCDSPRK